MHELTTKVLLTLLVAVIWVFMIMGGVLAKARTIQTLQRQEGISNTEARVRVTMVMNLIAFVESAAAVVALLLIW